MWRSASTPRSTRSSATAPYAPGTSPRSRTPRASSRSPRGSARPCCSPGGPPTPVTLGGVDIPAGTEPAHSPYALHRDPDLFPNPTAFDTERWNDADPSRMPPRPGSSIPFGAGRHTRIGDAFAVAEILSAVASVARRRRLAHAPAPP
ncbi:cytochrome P450 [Streptomyces tamarix]|uniref:cytochrome P450 n=1 Tax=Streptomyces tamarix TaxID=3078565 RepID=UPI003704BA01